MSVTNTKLYEAIKEFLGQSINLLEGHIGKDLIDLIETKSEKDRDHYYDLLSEPTFSKILSKYEDDILRLPGFINCQIEMRNDIIISKHLQKYVGTYEHLIYTDAKNYLFYILSKLLGSYIHNNKFDELYDKLYHDLELLFYNSDIPVVDVVPLDKFESDVDIIDVDENLRIRKLTKEEVNILIKEARDLNLAVAVSDIRAIKYVIEYRRNMEKITEEKANLTSRLNERMLQRLNLGILPTDILIEKIITAMRLFKKGAVGYNFILHTILLDTVIPSGLPAYFGARKFTYGQNYNLLDNEVIDFQNFWQTIKSRNVSYKKIEINTYL